MVWEGGQRSLAPLGSAPPLECDDWIPDAGMVCPSGTTDQQQRAGVLLDAMVVADDAGQAWLVSIRAELDERCQWTPCDTSSFSPGCTCTCSCGTYRSSQVSAAQLVIEPAEGGEPAIEIPLELHPTNLEPSMDARYRDGRFEVVLVDQGFGPAQASRSDNCNGSLSKPSIKPGQVQPSRADHCRSRITKRAPWLYCVSSSSVPPWASTTALLIAKPRPVPCSLSVV